MIPVYKNSISDNERYSLKQCVSILGSKYDIVLVGPNSLFFDYYKNIANYNFNILKCNPDYFKNLATYSYLCETTEFYECFKQYKFMLLYQLDGWIFKDNLRKYIMLDYDYIGSPWKAGTFDCKIESVGNGGVSFRKIQTFIDICKSIQEKDRYTKFVKFEDYCKTCKYKNVKDDQGEEPCCSCLEECTNTYSHKPVNYVKDENIKENKKEEPKSSDKEE